MKIFSDLKSGNMFILWRKVKEDYTPVYIKTQRVIGPDGMHYNAMSTLGILENFKEKERVIELSIP